MTNINSSTVSINLDGKVISEPTIIKEINNTSVYSFKISVKRNNGVVDTFTLNMAKSIGTIPKVDDFISVKGNIRTITGNITGEPLLQFIGVSEIEYLDTEPVEYKNDVRVTNALIDSDLEFSIDKNSSNKHICYFNTRLNYKINKVSLIQCNTFNSAAKYMIKHGKKGMFIDFKGRLQSKKSTTSDKIYTSIAVYYISLVDDAK